MKYVGEIYIVFTGDGISPAWNGDCLFYKAMDYFPAEGEESQGTATVAANGNGISVDPASANAIDNGQSRVANNSNSSPLTNEGIGRLASIMPNLPAQVQEQVRQAMAMTLRGKSQYNGKAMNKAGRVEALMLDGGRIEARGNKYFAVAPNGSEVQVTKGEHNYYEWLKKNGFGQQKKPEPAKEPARNNNTPLLEESNFRDFKHTDSKAELEQERAARQAENQGNKKATAEGGEVILPDGYNIESGKTLNEADAHDFIVQPNGSKDFGNISAQMEDATGGKLKSAPVRLQVGNKDFGYIHIMKHLEQIKQKGYDVMEYIEHILNNFSNVYSQQTEKKPYRFVLYCNDESKGFMPIDLELESGNNYYTIVSLMPHRSKIKGTSIFDGSANPSIVTTDDTLLAESNNEGGVAKFANTHGKNDVPSVTSSVAENNQDGNENSSNPQSENLEADESEIEDEDEIETLYDKHLREEASSGAFSEDNYHGYMEDKSEKEQARIKKVLSKPVGEKDTVFGNVSRKERLERAYADGIYQIAHWPNGLYLFHVGDSSKYSVKLTKTEVEYFSHLKDEMQQYEMADYLERKADYQKLENSNKKELLVSSAPESSKNEALGTPTVSGSIVSSVPQKQENGKKSSKNTNPKNKAVVWSKDGKEYNVHYEVRPESEIVTSNTADGSTNENYPKELQPRNRKRMGNMTQVHKIAGNLKPSLLTSNTMLNLGAPLIRQDGAVLNGNGRMMAIRTALKNGTDHNYKDYLIQHAEEFGLNAADIEGMDNPVLVKVVDDKLTKEDIDSIINDTSGGQRMSASEQAKADAKKIKDTTLGMYRPNKKGELTGENTDFLAAVLGDILPSDELNAYYGENGGITKDGVQRAQRALFALAYGNDHLIDAFAESTNEQAKNFINALNANAPYVAKLQRMIENGNAYDLNLRDSLVIAINELRETILSGKPAERIWRESSMFEEAELSPEVKTMAKIMNDFRKSGKKLTNFIGSMVERGFRHGDPNQVSMFGVSHIIAKRNSDYEKGRSSVDGITTAKKLIEVIANGRDKDIQFADNSDEARMRIHYNGYTAILSMPKNGNNWLLTGWEDDRVENKNEASVSASDERDDSSAATAGTTPFTRHTRETNASVASSVPQKQQNGKIKRSRSRDVGISPSTDGITIAQNANNNLLASMKGIVNKLNPLHHEELENLRIDRKEDNTDLSLVEYTFTSAARLAKKYKAVEPFFNIAKQAVTKQEQLRYYFNSKMNEIDETLGWSKLKNDPKFKERKEQLQKILFDGDIEGREYTNAEHAKDGYGPEVIKAYSQMRSLLDYAWKIANDTKSRIKYHSLACRSAAIADAEFADIKAKNPFAEIISKVKNADGTVTLNYKEPHTYHVAARNMTVEELETLKQDKDVHIQSVKQSAIDGNVVVT